MRCLPHWRQVTRVRAFRGRRACVGRIRGPAGSPPRPRKRPSIVMVRLHVGEPHGLHLLGRSGRPGSWPASTDQAPDARSRSPGGHPRMVSQRLLTWCPIPAVRRAASTRPRTFYDMAAYLPGLAAPTPAIPAAVTAVRAAFGSLGKSLDCHVSSPPSSPGLRPGHSRSPPCRGDRGRGNRESESTPLALFLRAPAARLPRPAGRLPGRPPGASRAFPPTCGYRAASILLPRLVVASRVIGVAPRFPARPPIEPAARPRSVTPGAR